MTDDRRRWLMLGVVLLAYAMTVLDATVVNVALPAIQSDLHFSPSGLTWVINAYLITFGAFLLVAGRLGDLIGRRRAFLYGVVAFALERRERWRLIWLLIPQRIGYRQVMYYVVLKAITTALRGPRVGWGKLERTGRVAA